MQDLTKALILETFKAALGPAGGGIVGNVNDFAIDPLVTAATTEGTPDQKADAWILAMGQAGLGAVWPPYGLLLSGGKAGIGTALYTVEQMNAATQAQKIEGILFGCEQGGLLASVDYLCDKNFMSIPAMEGITLANFGEKIRSEAELKQKWAYYRRALVDELPLDKETVDLQLAAAYPRLYQFWEMKRTRYAMVQLAQIFDQAMRDARAKAARNREERQGAMANRTHRAGVYELIEVRVEPQIITPVAPTVYRDGDIRTDFEIKGSGPALDTVARMAVDIPPQIENDRTQFTVKASVQGQFNVKANPLWAWMGVHLNVIGRGGDKNTGTESQAPGSYTLFREQEVTTTFAQETLIGKWEKDGKRYRQVNVLFGAYGAEYGVLVKFIYELQVSGAPSRTQAPTPTPYGGPTN